MRFPVLFSVLYFVHAGQELDTSALGIINNQQTEKSRNSVLLPEHIHHHNDSSHLSPQDHKKPHNSTVHFTDLLKVAKENYAKIIPCLLNNIRGKDKRLENMVLPADAEAHYHDLLEKTKVLRGVPYHAYSGYNGPWIENHFIDSFMHKPFSFFGGFVPIFAQFVDLHVYEMSTEESKRVHPDPKQIIELLTKWLRHDVIYLVVSQDDQGIGLKLMTDFPNILVLSAGGYGHIPIPLIKGELNYSEPKKDHRYSTEVGFYGNIRPALSRSKILSEFNAAAHGKGMGYRAYSGVDWIKQMQDTKFNLAPRGYGRTSFRLAEIVQSGRVPVYLFDDVPWLPYEHSNMSWSAYGYTGQFHRLGGLIDQLKSTTLEQYNDKVQQVKTIREWYTYAGVIKQIDLFLLDPLGPTNFLRCERVPDKDKRRLGEGADLHNLLMDENESDV